MRAKPPNRNNVMERTLILYACATALCESSCSTTDAKNRRLVRIPTVQLCAELQLENSAANWLDKA